MEDNAEAIRALRRRARARVGLPAKFMVIMAALGLGIGVVLTLVGFGATDGNPPPTETSLARRPLYRVLGPFAMLWCGFIGYGAWEMDRLGNYRAAQIAAWMAVVPVPIPAYVLWMIGAILGIVALNDPAVRAAFASGNGNTRAEYLAEYPYRPRGRPGGWPAPDPFESEEDD